jgi:hypothetical protein
LDADFSTIWVTHDYGKTIGWQFTSGRDFSRNFSTDTAAIVINEAAVKFMNIQKPVGTIVEWGDRKYSIIGVVKDMLMESPYEPVRQAVYLINDDNVNWIFLKLHPSKAVQTSLSEIEAVFKKHIPSAPFDYQFADEAFGEKFASEERISKLTGFLRCPRHFHFLPGSFWFSLFCCRTAYQRNRNQKSSWCVCS